LVTAWCCLVAAGWWLLVGGCWLVAAGWWLLGGCYLVAPVLDQQNQLSSVQNKSFPVLLVSSNTSEYGPFLSLDEIRSTMNSEYIDCTPGLHGWWLL